MTMQAHLADGTVLEFPDGTPEAVINKVAKSHSTPAKEPKKSRYGATDLAASKFTMGLSDKAGAFGTALGNLGAGRGFDYAGARDQEQIDKAAYQSANPGVDWATSPVNFLGGGAVATGLAPARAAVAAGGVGGGAMAIGGDNPTPLNVMLSTIGGGTLGLGMSKAAPFIGQKLGDLAKGGTNTVERVQRYIADRLAADGTDVASLGPQIAAARARGVPLAPMDTGPQMQRAAAAIARKSGPGSKIITDTVGERQLGQTERVQSAIARDLGQTANVRAASEKLIEEARAKADPLYKAAYANPVPQTETLTALLGRPAMKDATSRAYKIAQEEGRDPSKMGFKLDAEGNVNLESHPSMETLDYIKRGLDDVIEVNRDKVTGQLNLDEAGRAVNATKRAFLNELDTLNPVYKEARAAYSGPAQMATALAKGNKAANKSGEDIWAETRDLNPAELEQYKLGFRSALSRALEGKVDGADKVRAIVGTPAKRKVLAQLFGGSDNFANFIATLGHEGATSKTFSRVTGNSLTAENALDDADLSHVADTAHSAYHAAKGNFMPALAQAWNHVSDKISGETGKKVRAQVAALIANSDPALLQDAVRAAAAKKAAGAPVRRAVGTAAAINAGKGGAITLGALGGGE